MILDRVPLKPLWAPSRSVVEQSNLKKFQNWLFVKKGLYFRDYHDLWDWSVTDIEDFWECIWSFCDIKTHSLYSVSYTHLDVYKRQAQKGKLRKKLCSHRLKTRRFGIWALDTTSGTISDSIISNNGDRNQILATVASATFIFSEHHPSALIYIEGSTPSRTRLYRIGIASYFEDISETFVVWGLFNNEWQSFQINKAYDAFLVKRK